jgi:hypothetical protein
MIFLTLAQVSKTAFQEKDNTIKIETAKQTFAITERAQCFVYTIAKNSFYTMSQKKGTKNLVPFLIACIMQTWIFYLKESHCSI